MVKGLFDYIKEAEEVKGEKKEEKKQTDLKSLPSLMKIKAKDKEVSKPEKSKTIEIRESGEKVEVEPKIDVIQVMEAPDKEVKNLFQGNYPDKSDLAEINKNLKRFIESGKTTKDILTAEGKPDCYLRFEPEEDKLVCVYKRHEDHPSFPSMMITKVYKGDRPCMYKRLMYRQKNMGEFVDMECISEEEYESQKKSGKFEKELFEEWNEHIENY